MTTQPKPPFVFAVRREFADAIIKKIKTVEYRRLRPGMDPGEMFLIYQTRKVGIVATARLGAIISGTPTEVWHATHERGGISRVAYMEYFNGSAMAYALELEDVIALPEPVPLPAGMTAPQSWRRLTCAWPIGSPS